MARHPGANNTLWRADLAVANLTTQTVALSLTYLTGTSSTMRSATLEAGNGTEWVNVLESLFGVRSEADTQDAIQVASDEPLHISAVDYDQTAAGTFGRDIRALTATAAITPRPGRVSSRPCATHPASTPTCVS